MAAASDSDTKRFRYLLGLSSQLECESIESNYFANVSTFEEMLAAEDDLMDSYARGELTGEERLRFEKRFLTSPPGKRRVQFARAFSGVICEALPNEAVPRFALLVGGFRGSRAAFRIAAISAAVLVFVVLLSLVHDRQRMSNELRNLRGQSVELQKQNQELQRAQKDQPNRREVDTTRTPRASKVARTEFAINHESPINTQDATLGASFAPKGITPLPLKPNNVANLLTLQPAVTPNDATPAAQSDQVGATLGGVVITDLAIQRRAFADPLTLQPGIPALTPLPPAGSREWIRLRLILADAEQHTDYRVTLLAADDRSLFSVDWIEPVTPDQMTIETPVIPTTNLPSGDYRLLLLGKEPDGSFVKVAEYFFKWSGN